MKNTDIEIQRFYNDIAHQLADDWYCNDSLTPALKSFVSLLKSKPRILDLRCGAGYESMRLHNLGAEVVGIDYAAEPIRIARERNPQCTFEVMDFRKIDNQIGHFDGIAAIASIIHIPNDELAGLFKSMKNILNPNGFIMLVVIEGDGLCKERSIIEVNGFTSIGLSICTTGKF